jgi:ketosteroid isomerase-like protein
LNQFLEWKKIMKIIDQPVNQEAAAQELMKQSRAWAKAASSKNKEETLDFWSDDAVVMMPGQPKFEGKEAIRQMIGKSMQAQGFEANWEPKAAFVSQSGDLGYVLTHNYFKMPDLKGNMINTFNKGVEIWRKQEDGSWKCVVDIFNEDPTLTSIN